jgi:hypothetical protein
MTTIYSVSVVAVHSRTVKASLPSSTFEPMVPIENAKGANPIFFKHMNVIIDLAGHIRRKLLGAG